MTVNYNAYLQQAYRQYKADEELSHQALVVRARDLYEGTIDAALKTEIELALLSKDGQEVLSLFDVYGTKIDERASRLNITHLSETRYILHPNAPIAPLSEWATLLWTQGNMDEMQHELFVTILRDGEAFILLSPEMQPDGNVKVVPRLHERYTQADAGGNNSGMRIHYPDDDDTQPPIAITKRWIESYTDNQGRLRQRQRMTIFRYPKPPTKTEPALPTIIEKWHMSDGQWEPFHDGEEPWPLIWEKDNNYLPFPIIHFRNIMKRIEGRKMMGPQVIIDNLVTAITSTSSSIAIPGLIVIGGYPTTDGQPIEEDGSNVWVWGPNQVIGFPNRRPQEASITPSKPGDVSQLIEALRQMITLSSITTGTPTLIADQVGRQQVSGEALRQIDIRPTADVRQMQVTFGNKITHLMATWTEIQRAFGQPELPESPPPVYAHWLPADVRDFDTIAEPGEKTEDIEPAVEEVYTIPSMTEKTIE